MIVKKVSGAIGAIIQGVQLDEKLDENTFSDIYSAFLKYQVIFFRNQNFIPESLISFAKNIGRPITYPFVKGYRLTNASRPALKFGNFKARLNSFLIR